MNIDLALLKEQHDTFILSTTNAIPLLDEKEADHLYEIDELLVHIITALETEGVCTLTLSADSSQKTWPVVK